jgi:hypothetical protein
MHSLRLSVQVPHILEFTNQERKAFIVDGMGEGFRSVVR